MYVAWKQDFEFYQLDMKQNIGIAGHFSFHVRKSFFYGFVRRLGCVHVYSRERIWVAPWIEGGVSLFGHSFLSFTIDYGKLGTEPKILKLVYFFFL